MNVLQVTASTTTKGSDRVRVQGKASSLRLVGALTFSLLALLLVPAFASAALEHAPRGIFGSAAQPTFVDPAGMAVDQSTGDVLVIDNEAGTLSRFQEDGTASNFTAPAAQAAPQLKVEVEGPGSGEVSSVGGLGVFPGCEEFGNAFEGTPAIKCSGSPPNRSFLNFRRCDGCLA
jgi:hypothetical protein